MIKFILGFGLFYLMLIFTISALVGAFCWTYTINTWLMVAGKPPCVVWWQGALIGFVPGIGQAGLPLAVITWIAMLFVGS